MTFWAMHNLSLLYDFKEEILLHIFLISNAKHISGNTYTIKAKDKGTYLFVGHDLDENKDHAVYASKKSNFYGQNFEARSKFSFKKTS